MRRNSCASWLLATFGLAAEVDITPQDIRKAFAAEGYSRDRIVAGENETKVNVVRSLETFAVVYDTATGAVRSVRSAGQILPGTVNSRTGKHRPWQLIPIAITA